MRVDSEVIRHLVTEAILLTLKLSAPLVGVAAAIGLFFGVVQALTQLQDQTTALAFKVLAIFGLLALLAPWFGVELLGFSERLFEMLTTVR